MDPDARLPQQSRRRSQMDSLFRKQCAMHRNIPGKHSSTLIEPAWDNSFLIECSGHATRSRRMNKPVSGLYAITPELTDSIGLFEKVNAALRGGAQVVQYRAKFIPESLRLEQAKEIAGFCRSHNALFIVNDSIALTRAVHADGIHIGRNDADIPVARDALGPGTLIGVSCYNDMTLARNAVLQGADYVAFGSFYASNTKPKALRASVGLLQLAASELSLPV